VARSDWTDGVYLSTDATLDASDVLLADEDAAARSPLAAGAAYTVSRSVRIADLGGGTRYLLFVADRGNTQLETNETNNVRAAAVSASAADLVVGSVNGPTAAQPGRPVTVSWAVDNVSTLTAGGPWVDRVYLSTTGSVTGATLLGSVTRTAALPGGGHYTASGTFTLPDLADGDYQVLVGADAAGAVAEVSEAHNTAAAPGTLPVRHAH